jgi:hypothetical protein
MCLRKFLPAQPSALPADIGAGVEFDSAAATAIAARNAGLCSESCPTQPGCSATGRSEPRSINALDLAALRVLAARIDVVHPEGKTSWIRLAIEVVNIVLPDKNWVLSIGWWFH